MKKIMDEKGRLFGKVSIIDIFVLLFALVMVFAVYLRFFSNETTSVRGGSDTITYTIRVNGVRQWAIDGFHLGDKVWEPEFDLCIGTITKIETTPSTWEYDLMNGTQTVAGSEGRYDVYLTLETEGLISKGHYYASRTYELGANFMISFYTKYCNVMGTIWSVG